MNALFRILISAALLAGAMATEEHPRLAAAQNPIYIVNGTRQSPNVVLSGDDVKTIETLENGFSKFTNFPAGYSMLIPGHFTEDISLGAVRVLFSDPTTQIEVYYDNFTGSISSSLDYIYYGNSPTLKNKHHSILQEYWTELDGYRAHITEWNRRKLSRVVNDKNHYVCAQIIKNEHEVYTLFIKSAEPLSQAADIISSFRIIEKQGLAKNYIQNRPVRPKLNTETTAFYNTYFSPASDLTWGIFEPSAPETMHYLLALEKKLEYKFPFLLRYQGLDETVPVRSLQKAYDANRFVELTLQTTYSEDVNALLSSGSRNESILYAILDGQYDDYFHEYAQKLKAYGHPVLFRLNNEMNGDWCWYSAYYTGKDTDIYKEVWRYIHRIFAANQTDNVLWVWNPHDVSRPDFKWNHYLMYYPGDDYVDIIGLTGYNTGTYFPGEYWRNFHEIYPPLYADYTASFAKPFMITEFGSNSVGGSKPAWIEAMFDQIGQLPNIKVAIWWSGTDWDQQGNAGRIYVLDETENTTEVFHKRLQQYRSDAQLSPHKTAGERFTLQYPQAKNPALSSFNQAILTEAEAAGRELSQPELSGSVDYRVNRNSNDILSITLKKFSYRKQAAHPMTFWKSYTYNSRTGKPYELKDLFKPGTDYRSELNRQITYQITDRQIHLLRPFHGIKPDQEFYLTPDNLVLYYQLYEYTPYVYGFLTFTIPFEEIQPLLKEEIFSGARGDHHAAD